MCKTRPTGKPLTTLTIIIFSFVFPFLSPFFSYTTSELIGTWPFLSSAVLATLLPIWPEPKPDIFDRWHDSELHRCDKSVTAALQPAILITWKQQPPAAVWRLCVNKSKSEWNNTSSFQIQYVRVRKNTALDVLPAIREQGGMVLHQDNECKWWLWEYRICFTYISIGKKLFYWKCNNTKWNVDHIYIYKNEIYMQQLFLSFMEYLDFCTKPMLNNTGASLNRENLNHKAWD